MPPLPMCVGLLTKTPFPTGAHARPITARRVDDYNTERPRSLLDPDSNTHREPFPLLNLSRYVTATDKPFIFRGPRD